MSFSKIKFSFTPPPTLDSRAGAPAVPAPPAPAAGAASAANNSLAAGLLDRVAALKAAGLYLQSLVLAKSQGIGIVVDPNGGPNLAIALTRLYSSDQPPAGMTVDMYNNLLDTEMAIMRADMALAGSSSLLQVSPAQKADLLVANEGFENSLVATGAAAYQTPMLLRQLKGNDVMLDGITTALQAYPVLAGSSYAPAPPPAASIVTSNPVTGVTNLSPTVSATSANWLNVIDKPVMDINSATAAAIGTRLDSLQSQYSAVYGLCAGIDQVTANISEITTQFLGRDVQDLVMIISMVSSMKMLFHKPALTELKGTAALLLLPRLVAEASIFNALMDRVIQSVTAPAQAMLTTLNGLTGVVASAGNEVAYLAAEAGQTGLIGNHIAGSNKPLSPKRMQELDAIPKAMGKLTGYLNWGIQEVIGRATEIENSFFKAMDRRLLGTGGQLDLMQSLREVDALIGLLQSIIQAQQAGSTPSAGTPSPSLTRVLNSATPASPSAGLPAPPAAVAKLLSV
jgi:hypothetical protein